MKSDENIKIAHNNRHFDPPTKHIKNIQPYRSITVLPQSDTHILMIWNVSQNHELETKAWQIKNEFGLDILLPGHSRSVILPINLLPNLYFQIFRISNNDEKTLFGEYSQPDLPMYKTIPTQISHNTCTSGNHFLKPHKASENHLRK